MGKHQLWSDHLEPQLHVWQDEAACAGADTNLFLMLDGDDEPLRGLDRNEQRDQLAENFEDALSYCDRCPVVADCLKNAERADLKWSVRGGKYPKAYEGQKRLGRPVGGHEATRKRVSRKCKRNHVVPEGDYRCKMCRAISKKAYEKRIKEQAAFRAGQDDSNPV